METRVSPARTRSDTQVRFWVNGEDLVQTAFGEDGRGLYAADALPAGSPSLLRATGQARRLELGEPHCTGGRCGFLAVAVQRVGESVQWSSWEIPWGQAPSNPNRRSSTSSSTTPKSLAPNRPAGSRNTRSKWSVSRGRGASGRNNGTGRTRCSDRSRGKTPAPDPSTS